MSNPKNPLPRLEYPKTLKEVMQIMPDMELRAHLVELKKHFKDATITHLELLPKKTRVKHVKKGQISLF